VSPSCCSRREARREHGHGQGRRVFEGAAASSAGRPRSPLVAGVAIRRVGGPSPRPPPLPRVNGRRGACVRHRRPRVNGRRCHGHR
jgi:hypothetical protein